MSDAPVEEQIWRLDGYPGKVLTAGPPPGGDEPPLIFIHGAFAGAWTWGEHFLDWFGSRGYSCIAADLPGRVGSAEYDTLHDLGIEDYTDSVVRLIKGMPTPPILIGHSMGGFVAMNAAMKTEVAGAALINSVPPSGLMGPSVTLALTRPDLSYDIARIQTFGESAARLETLHDSIFSANVPEEITKKLMPKFQAESRKAVLELHQVMFPPLSGLFGKPLLVTGSERDNLIPPMHIHATAAFFGKFPVILPKLGHVVMLEPNWREAADRITQWLTTP